MFSCAVVVGVLILCVVVFLVVRTITVVTNLPSDLGKSRQNGGESCGEDVFAAVCAVRQRRRQFDPQALPLLRSAGWRAKQHARRLPRSGSIGRSVETRVVCSTCAATSPQTATARVHGALRNAMDRRPQSDHRSHPRGWLGLRGSRRGLVRGRLGVGGEHEHRAARDGLWNAAFPHPRCRWGRALRALHVLAHCARLPSTLRTAASLSKAFTSVGVRPPWPTHQRGQICGATSGARSMPGEAWATTCPCAR